MKEFINSLKQKPRAVRERIVAGASLGITGVIALGWIAVMVVTNPFAPTPATPEGTTFSEAISETRSGFENLIGGAAAANRTTAESEEGITIVDTGSDDVASPPPTAISF